ncbi:hypothetical protein [Alicyclobacillus sp. ALC3]|uniref:hypothetical protein n=1 Tax=Alicyclobacillus sp. ALC3 TaxID=2796143 RepID=UPI0023781025|nr:hypothetical protein [Alicyclobacillus sp. ALC3]WDL96912.1 hypothetical protein JC200_21975 [Alicyclobacillus sp. ALC3]
MKSHRRWMANGLQVVYEGYDDRECEVQYTVKVESFDDLPYLLSEDGIAANRGEIEDEVRVSITATRKSENGEGYWIVIQDAKKWGEPGPRVTLETDHLVTEGEFTERAQNRAQAIVRDLESVVGRLREDFDIKEADSQ